MWQVRRAVLALMIAAFAAAAFGGSARAAGLEWCGGSEEVAADRKADAVTGQQIHVVYAVPSDGADRFAVVAPQIAEDLAGADRWWRAQDSGRTLRFDLVSRPGCGSSLGMLDLSSLRLPHDSAYYDVAQGAQAQRLRADLAAVESSTYKKYLVYFDGPASQFPDVCGYSPTAPDAGGIAAAAFVLLRQGEGCGALGSGDYLAVTAIHELVHNLGALPPQPGPPHPCPDDAGHVCDDDRDLIHGGGGVFTTLVSYMLDVGRDDYYGHSGGWWDVQDSAWLLRLDAPQHRLTVRIGGSGAGTVASDVPGVLCTASCAADWQAGSQLSLAAKPAGEGTVFAGWSGACSGDTCSLLMDGPKEVVARFEQVVALGVRVVGGGSVDASTGDSCDGGTCSVSATKGAVVDFTAQPAAGRRFVGWTGACTGQGRCSVLADAAKSVTAVFGPATARLAVRVSGRGAVTSAPRGLACPTRCAASFSFDAQLRLTARPAPGWRLAAWSGGCKGRAACVVRAGSKSLVGARFVRKAVR